MSDPPAPRRRHTAWMVAALLALMSLSPSWGAAVLLAAVAWRVGGAALRRRRTAATERAARTGATAEGGILLGADSAGRGVVLSQQELSAHGLILGASGAGKSTTLLAIACARVREGRPVVAVDLKGSPAFAARLRQAAQASGRRLRVWTPDGPEQWNPLAHGNATELKDKLIATERFTEPHYQRAAERYVQAAIGVLQELAPDAPPALGALVDMLEPRRLAAAARRLAPERSGRLRDYLDSLSNDQLSAIRGLGSRLAIISESHTGRYLEPAADGIDLRRALEGGDVVLFSLNSSTYGSLSAQLGTLVIQDLVAASGNRLARGAGGPGALVAIDEFSALGSDNLISLLARGRESGVSVLLATQELADLDRASRGLRDQILGNTAVKIAHRQDVAESAETVARLAGRERVWERSYQVRPGPFGGADLGRGTLRLVERYAIDPGRVQTLPPGEAVVIVKSPRSSARLTRVIPTAGRDGVAR